MAKPPSKPAQSSPKMSSLAAKVMSGSVKPTPAQVRSLAASVVRQDQTPGQKPGKR